MTLLASYLEELQESDPEEGENKESESQTQKLQSNGIFSSYREKVKDPVKLTNEISEYEKFELSKFDIDSDPFQFWMSKTGTFPKLSNIALWILAIPATSTSSERVFSKLGNMTNPLRNLLDPETVNKLSFIGSNDDLM